MYQYYMIKTEILTVPLKKNKSERVQTITTYHKLGSFLIHPIMKIAILYE